MGIPADDAPVRWLIVVSGPDAGLRTRVLPKGTVIGRDPSCDLVLSDSKVSRRHAKVTLPEGRQALVEDLGSRNGTFLDGRPVSAQSSWPTGGALRVGDDILSLRVTTNDVDAFRASPVGLGAVAARADAASEQALESGPDESRHPSQSMVQRIVLQRSVRRANVLAAGAVLVSLVVVAVVASGILTARTPSVEEIAAAIRPSTVLVVNEINGERNASGTGWVFDGARGLVVTNHHVVNGGTSFKVGIGQRSHDATLVGTAPCEDLAVLRVPDASGLKPLILGSQQDLQAGATAVALGYPLNASMQDDLVVAQGIVSVVKTKWVLHVRDVPLYPDVIQTTAAINPGNSGGPLVDGHERLIGVNSAGLSELGLENSNYAIGVDRVKEIVPGLADGHSISWTGAGFSEYLTTDLLASDQQLVDALRQAGLPARPGILIQSVLPGTPAARTLGQLPAILVAVNQAPLDGTLQSYCKAVGDSRSGSSAVFSLVRPGEDVPADVTVPFE